MNLKLLCYEYIRNCLFHLLFLTVPENILLIGCCHCFSLQESIFQHYISGLFMDSFMVLRVYDTSCRRSHSYAMFKDPHIIIRALRYYEILLSSWYHFYSNITQCAHNSCHSENVSLMGCDAVPQCKQFLWF